MKPVRIAAVADLHCARRTQDQLRPLLTQMSDSADVILLGGDLTDYGLPEEAEILIDELVRAVQKPVVAVLGNHDFETGKQHEIRDILCRGGVTVLDGDSCEIAGIGFAGVKGFGGGYGEHVLEPWGEQATKLFVQEAVNETLKLEAALARLQARVRVALMHYSPIEETLAGEPREVYPFLGSRRLEEPINRYRVDAVFHGHVHAGAAEGKTSAGVPVYNVALPLLRRLDAGKPFRVVELNTVPAQPADAAEITQQPEGRQAPGVP